MTVTGVLNNGDGAFSNYTVGTAISFYMIGGPGTLPAPYYADDRFTNYHCDVSVMIGDDHFTTFVGEEGDLTTFHNPGSNGFQLSGNDGLSRMFAIQIYRPASPNDDFSPGGPIPDGLDLSTYTTSFWIETYIDGQFGHIDGFISAYLGTDTAQAVADSGEALAMLFPVVLFLVFASRFRRRQL